MVQSTALSEIVKAWLARSGDAYFSSLINTLLYAVSILAASYRWKMLQKIKAPFAEQVFWLLVVLILFVGLRAISLHQFGTVLNYEIWGARINWIAELFGIYWICLAIFWPCLCTNRR
ncbi:MAG: hypothetical protein ABFD75_10590 [Smithella sp.]